MERLGRRWRSWPPTFCAIRGLRWERAPELARDAATPEGMVALGAAIGAERRARLDLDERGRAAVRGMGHAGAGLHGGRERRPSSQAGA